MNRGRRARGPGGSGVAVPFSAGPSPPLVFSWFQQGRRATPARPRVFTYPVRQQAVITAAGGWQGVYTWYTPGMCGLFSKSTQTVMGGEEHRGQGAPVMAEALPNGKGHTGRRKRPRSIAEEPKHGRCRDEVWRYGCGEKPIQNPYGHEKTGHFTAPQDTIRNERKTP